MWTATSLNSHTSWKVVATKSSTLKFAPATQVFIVQTPHLTKDHLETMLDAHLPSLKMLQNGEK